ncbi:MAG: AIR synthase related protein, partial [Saprospiraceae bacterium]
MSSKYEQRGVSATKSEVHEAIKDLDQGLYPRAFCKILPDVVAGHPDYCNVMHADTAGTKTSLAYLYWRETGDLSVWEGIVQDSLVMNLDDMGCVGCVKDIMVSSTIGRNANVIPGEVLTVLIQAAKKFADRMAAHGVNLHLTGGETADVGDVVRTVDVGFTTFARLARKDLIVNDIRPGQVIVGLASYGRATYEDTYNGGMGSNGLTSARHDIFHSSYAEKYPESFNPALDRSVVYTGSRRLTDPITVDGEETTV